MKGPSLEAIRKFKQLQEEKKRLEYDKKVKEKLTTLEHRAAHGDKKAKTQLKHIEKIEEDRSKPEVQQGGRNARPSGSASNPGASNTKSVKGKSSCNKPKQAVFDFDALMKVAANNTNEVKCVKKEPGPKERRPIPRCQSSLSTSAPRERPVTTLKQSMKIAPERKASPGPPVRPAARPSAHPSVSNLDRRSMIRHHTPEHIRARLPTRSHYYEDDDYDDDDDYYESDGFVVDDEDTEVKDELSKTLRTVFRYDKRRCDLREQELDRQYRAIGRVNTFEDLEREERRASRLAAAEDAAALRDLEERKRIKKQRLKDMR